MSTTHKPAAFFDFDGTLLSVDSAGIGVKYLWERGEIPAGLMIAIVTAHFFYQRRYLSIETMTRLVLKLYRGKKLVDFQAGVGEFYHRELKPLLAPAIVNRLRKHREDGHVVVLLSASVRYMLQEVCQDLSIDHLLCTDLQIGGDGLLTGRSSGLVCLGEEKARKARKLAEECNLDLSQSWAYSDHISDLPILELIGHPVAVHPDEQLRRQAETHRWQIMNHRE